MANIADTIEDLVESLQHYPQALHKSVASVYKCGTILCCRLENDLIIGGQFAFEHEHLEVLLGRIQDLPAAFRDSSIRDQREFLLKGRRFRGFVACKDDDLGFNFGRYMIRFAYKSRSAVLLPRRIDSADFWDVPRDSLKTIEDVPRDSLKTIEDEMADFMRLGDRR